MPSFDHLDDFDKALEVAARVFPEQDLKKARVERSGYDGNTIWLRDREGSLIVSFNSEEFGTYILGARKEPVVAKSSGPSFDAESSRHDKKHMQFSQQYLKQGPQSAQMARSLLGIIYGLSSALFWVAVGGGVVLAIHSVWIGNVMGVIIGLLVLPFFAVLSYFATRLMYVGLEMVADIATDLRAVRDRLTVSSPSNDEQV